MSAGFGAEFVDLALFTPFVRRRLLQTYTVDLITVIFQNTTKNYQNGFTIDRLDLISLKGDFAIGAGDVTT